MTETHAARKPHIALIIPALNEEETIGHTLSRVPPDLYETIVIADNGSTDRTAEIARTLGAIVVNEPERGYGAACLKALLALPVDADIAVFMQADGSEDPAQARQLIRPLLEGRADLVLGSRTSGVSDRGALQLHQKVGNFVATSMIAILFGHRFSDLGPYRAICLNAYRRLGMCDRGYGWTVEMQVRALHKNLRVVEVPVSYSLRVAGTNKISGNLRASLQAGFKIIFTVIKLAVVVK
ncbi:MAG: glycosyltransferase family 2 protein [Bryobacteraceae bacterium]